MSDGGNTWLSLPRKVCYMNHREFLDPNHKWRSDKRRFNGDVETGKCPQMLSGREVEVLLDGYVNNFGKGKKTKGTLKKEVEIPLIRLGEFLRGICTKVIELDDVKRLQQEIIEILCQLEMAIAKRNTEARSQVTDTHTAGPVSFAQICNKLVLERPQVDVDADQDQDQDPDQDPKEAQPPRLLSEADIFIATHKRDEKRTYKLPTDAVQKKIVMFR
ncbi:hypothetical protein POM88_034548 [Heracleum sosnowskyi]|uniref:Uncharacterized protein n=1 Tax=Heracleum sosnowskyi TaxID=360622 RepID=A0AAD8HKR7_9APIA|nr:hypothetical protein POM88_034548 [Heracleum sosnowskyi]